MRLLKPLVFSFTLLACSGLSAHAAPSSDATVRYPAISDQPVATAVEVPGGSSLVYLSSTGAPIQDKTAPPRSIAAYGDTQTQTTGAIKQLEAMLQKLHLSLGDVVRLQIYVVASPTTQQHDFDSVMTAYSQFFGTAKQPNLPVQSILGVQQLANPGQLVEIEATAVRPTPKSTAAKTH